VLDYRSHHYPATAGPPILFVPSLINRASILDLASDYSFLRYLAAQGMHPFLLDWGEPTMAEQSFGLEEYITQRLEPALTVLGQHYPQAIHVAGYCMGGLFALALAQRRPRDVASLTLLATPWDFHAASTPSQRQILQALQQPLRHLAKRHAFLAPDVLQYLFMGTQPYSTVERFQAFGARGPAASDALFVRIEEWLNNGVPLAHNVAQQCLYEWYDLNTPYAGKWQVNGIPINPARLTQPVLVVAAQKDTIVPPASATAFVSQLAKGTLLQPAAGHIGMVTGRRAREILWEPLHRWISALL
jgi:polyhydroxyalkanoate synthase